MELELLHKLKSKDIIPNPNVGLSKCTKKRNNVVAIKGSSKLSKNAEKRWKTKMDVQVTKL